MWKEEKVEANVGERGETQERFDSCSLCEKCRNPIQSQGALHSLGCGSSCLGLKLPLVVFFLAWYLFNWLCRKHSSELRHGVDCAISLTADNFPRGRWDAGRQNQGLTRKITLVEKWRMWGNQVREAGQWYNNSKIAGKNSPLGWSSSSCTQSRKENKKPEIVVKLFSWKRSCYKYRCCGTEGAERITARLDSEWEAGYSSKYHFLSEEKAAQVRKASDLSAFIF